MALTTQQVKDLLLSAADLAADFHGMTEAEKIGNRNVLIIEFDEWVNRLQRESRVCKDFQEYEQRLSTGDRIRLVGDSWSHREDENGDTLKGQCVTVTSFDADGDPCFLNRGTREVAYGKAYGWGWALPDEDEEDDE